jgi:hypothetical protein
VQHTSGGQCQGKCHDRDGRTQVPHFTIPYDRGATNEGSCDSAKRVPNAQGRFPQVELRDYYSKSLLDHKSGRCAGRCQMGDESVFTKTSRTSNSAMTRQLTHPRMRFIRRLAHALSRCSPVAHRHWVCSRG